jgi:hypothetical protein
VKGTHGLPFPDEFQEKGDVPLHGGVGGFGIMVFDGPKDLGMLLANHTQVGGVFISLRTTDKEYFRQPLAFNTRLPPNE